LPVLFKGILFIAVKKYCPQKVGRAVAHVPADAYGMFLTALHGKMCGFINSVKILNSRVKIFKSS